VIPYLKNNQRKSAGNMAQVAEFKPQYQVIYMIKHDYDHMTLVAEIVTKEVCMHLSSLSLLTKK
jgi:hypothetical protein